MIISLSKRMLAVPVKTIVRAQRVKSATREESTLSTKAKKTSLFGDFEHLLSNQVNLIVRYED